MEVWKEKLAKLVAFERLLNQDVHQAHHQTWCECVDAQGYCRAKIISINRDILNKMNSLRYLNNRHRNNN